jgi:hypothetical protein
MPIWFDEADALTDQIEQAAMAEPVVEEVAVVTVATAAVVDDVLLTQKRGRDADDEEGLESPSKKTKR